MGLIFYAKKVFLKYAGRFSQFNQGKLSKLQEERLEKEVSGYELQYSKSVTFASGVTKKTFSETETSAKYKGLSSGVFYPFYRNFTNISAYRTRDDRRN